MRYTTVWGGAGLLVAAVLELLGFFHVAVPLGGEDSLVFGSGVPWVLQSAICAAALVVLAVGLRGETGIEGRSAVGRAALVVYGVGEFLLQASSALLNGMDLSLMVAVGRLTGVLSLVVLAAGIVAALMVVRAGVLGGVARWALLVFVGWQVCFTAVFLIPDVQLALALAPWAGVVQPVLLAATGAAYVVFGQGAAIRERAAAINRAW